MGEPNFAELPAAVQEFRPKCPGCTPAKVTTPDALPCSFYNCPGLPSELEVVCKVCVYNFASDDGTDKCDHSTCETAIRLKETSPPTTWIHLLETEAAEAQ